MSEKLLSEYQSVLKELEMIKNRASVIKDVTQDRLKCAKNDEEKKNIFLDFKSQLNKIKKDKNIKHKYKSLVKRKEIIETEILNKKSKKSKKYVSSSESETYEINVDCENFDISELIDKYKNNLSLKQKKHKHKSSSSSESIHENDNNTTIVVNVPTTCNNIYNNNSTNTDVNCSNKKNLYVNSTSDSCSDSDDSFKSQKNNFNDTHQVKKLYNLIRDLQGEIDK